ncbi:MAG: aldo/keto reductase [Steroidobacteraceae bacterium]|jgi:hypothetical protein
MDNCMLALGTVQFGMSYGIANRRGQVDLAEAKAILDHARAAGMDTLDTAMTYGTSEESLGSAGVDTWRVVSKLPALPDPCPDVEGWVRRATEASLGRLRLGRLGALLLHAPQDLRSANGEALYAALLAVRQDGLVDKIGISIYDPQELTALDEFRFDLVQAPFNIIDRRLAKSGWMDALRRAGVEIHVRSLFLQGLLLMRSDQRPGGFDRWQKLWDPWHQWLQESGLSAVEACLGFAAAHPQIDRMVVGVDGLAQLEEILRARIPARVHPPDGLSSDDPDLVNPSRWVAGSQR